jgi:hypothetical protein
MRRYWIKKKNKLKKKFSEINDKDLVYTVGKESEMIEKLQDKLGKTSKEVLGIIIDF